MNNKLAGLLAVLHFLLIQYLLRVTGKEAVRQTVPVPGIAL